MSTRLSPSLAAYLRADQWYPDAWAIVSENPDLLNPRNEGAIEDLIREARRRADPTGVRYLEQRRRLLSRCRTLGIDAAFSEMLADIAQGFTEIINSLVQAETGAEVLRILRDHPELLADTMSDDFADSAQDALAKLESDASEAGDPRFARLFHQRRRLLTRSREVGIDQAVAESVAQGTLR